VHDVHEFLRSLSIVLGVAALTTVLFHRLRQPVVLGYILAGLIVGPHLPVPIVADRTIVQTLSELGVILLMFSLGLEFSFAKLARIGFTAGITAVLQSGLMLWLGYSVGRLLGWTTLESVFAGAVIAISSTTIIAKVFDEQQIRGRLRELVVGILLVEDLMAVVFMTVLTAVASGVGLSARELGATVGRLAAFLAVLLVVGMLLVPRLVRAVVRIGSRETTLVASIGVCFATAFVAQQAGYSVALGAFLSGSLVAESGRAYEVEKLVEPVRDMFAAIFFVSVGMLIEPRLVAEHAGAIAAFTAIVIAGKVASVTVGAFITGNGARTSIRAGMSLAQIGEFSFIIAALGLSLGATRDFLYPVAVAVSAITTLTTPWLIRSSDTAAAWVDRKLPHRMQTFSTLYGTWFERLRARPAGGAGVARLLRLLVLDAAVLSALIVGTALARDFVTHALADAAGMDPDLAFLLLLAVASSTALPLVIGIGRLSRRLGNTLAISALPRAPDKADPGAAPRQALDVTLQLAVALGTGIAVLAVTQPFLPGFAGALLFAALLLGFGIAIWRSAAQLESHVRAGAEALVEALTRGARSGAARAHAEPLPEIHALLPGLGDPVAIALAKDDPATGRSLAELNLRGRTGATILAISREGRSIVAPAAGERLRAGDVLGLVGTQDAIEAAKLALLGESRAG
jgi:CPA2 family monovalent cation:H+ antiporter-2